MYTIIMIRDFPLLPIGFRGLYILSESSPSIDGAIMALKEEVKLRGGKYGGCVCLEGEGNVVYSLSQDGHPLEN